MNCSAPESGPPLTSIVHHVVGSAGAYGTVTAARVALYTRTLTESSVDTKPVTTSPAGSVPGGPSLTMSPGRARGCPGAGLPEGDVTSDTLTVLTVPAAIVPMSTGVVFLISGIFTTDDITWLSSFEKVSNSRYLPYTSS